MSVTACHRAASITISAMQSQLTTLHRAEHGPSRRSEQFCAYHDWPSWLRGPWATDAMFDAIRRHAMGAFAGRGPAPSWRRQRTPRPRCGGAAAAAAAPEATTPAAACVRAAAVFSRASAGSRCLSSNPRAGSTNKSLRFCDKTQRKVAHRVDEILAHRRQLSLGLGPRGRQSAAVVRRESAHPFHDARRHIGLVRHFLQRRRAGMASKPTLSVSAPAAGTDECDVPQRSTVTKVPSSSRSDMFLRAWQFGAIQQNTL